jgi:heat shock protein HtpX
MANLYAQKDSNIRKTWFFLTFFLVFVIAVGWIFSYVYQSPIILYIAVVLSLLMNVTAYWKSDKIALSMSGARPIKREENLRLYRIVENLCITVGLPLPRIYIIPGMQINAFATGRDPEHSAIAITEGALAKLNDNELAGVMAHEISHIGNRDILISTVVVVLAGLIAIMSDIFIRMSFFGGSNRDNRQGGGLMIVIGIIAAILAPIAASLIKLAVSRKREYLADASGALLTRYPEGLAAALEKIAQDQVPMRRAHNATAHLFLASPFKGKESKSWFSKLFMTHPPINERVRALREMKQ